MRDVNTEHLRQRVVALSPTKQRLLAHLAAESAPSRHAQPRQLVAFVSAAQANDDTADIQRFVAEQLPHYMTPSRIIELSALPRTPNGKVDRARLELVARDQRPVPPAPATEERAGDDIDRQLRVIWCTLLGVPHVGAYDDFFDLGGHSLLAVRMLAQVKAELGHDLPVALIVESPTIARLAEHIRAARAVPRVAPDLPAQSLITALQPQGARPPLYLLPLHIHGALHYRHLKDRLGAERPLYGFAGFDASAPGQTIETLAHTFADALLDFQPHGPYYLGGISVAGLLAIELARQLRLRGIEQVAVILFDTWGPGYPQRLPASAAVAQWLRRTGAAGGSPAAHTLDRLTRPLEQGYAALKMMRAARRRGAPTASEPLPGFTANNDPDLHLADVDETLGALTSAYLKASQRFDGSVILFRAGLQPWNARYDATLGWRQVVDGDIHVEHVRGDHLGILRRRHAAALADALARQLTRLDLTNGRVSAEG